VMLWLIVALLFSTGHCAPTPNEAGNSNLVPLLVKASTTEAPSTSDAVGISKFTEDAGQGSGSAGESQKLRTPINSTIVETNSTHNAAIASKRVAEELTNVPIETSALEKMIVKSVKKAVQEIVETDLSIVESAIKNDTKAEAVINEQLKKAKEVDGPQTTKTNDETTPIQINIKGKDNLTETVSLNATMADKIIKALDTKQNAEKEIISKIIEIETVKNIEGEIVSTISNKTDDEIITIGETLAAKTENNTEKTNVTIGNSEDPTLSIPMSMVIAMVIKAATEQLMKNVSTTEHNIDPNESFALASISSTSSDNSTTGTVKSENNETIFVIINDEQTLNSPIVSVVESLDAGRIAKTNATTHSNVAIIEDSEKDVVNIVTSTKASTNPVFDVSTIPTVLRVKNTQIPQISTTKVPTTGNADVSNDKNIKIVANIVEITTRPTVTLKHAENKVIIDEGGDVKIADNFIDTDKVGKQLNRPDASVTEQSETSNPTKVPASSSDFIQVATEQSTLIENAETGSASSTLKTTIISSTPIPLAKNSTPEVRKQVPQPASQNLLVNDRKGFVVGSTHFGSSVAPTNFILGKPVQVPTVIFNSGPPLPIPPHMDPMLMVEPRFRKFIFPNDSPDVLAAKVNFFQVRSASPGGAMPL